MPPKPVSQNEADAEFYNIDFSYQTQLRYAAGHSPSAIQSECKQIATIQVIQMFIWKSFQMLFIVQFSEFMEFSRARQHLNNNELYYSQLMGFEVDNFLLRIFIFMLT